MTDESQRAGRRWTVGELKNPKTLATVFVVFVAVSVASQLAACNVHEVAHAVVATALGWKVDTIQLCAPGSGAVVFAHVGTWAANLQGYAGGAVAAALLYWVYSRLIAKPARPDTSPLWWAAGLGIVVWIGPQLVVGVMEGSAGPNEDYTDLFRSDASIFVPLVAVAAVSGPVLFFWRWHQAE